MIKLLVTDTSGIQKIITIHKSGGYFDKAKVAWDERLDGPMPQIVELGGLYKEDEVLKVDLAKKAIHDAAVAAKEAAKQAKEDLELDLESRKDQIRALLADWDNLTLTQLRQILRYFVKKELKE
jgi:hypothetical protein